MHRNIRRCIQDFLYVVVLLELFLVLFIFPIALLNRSTAVTSRSNRAKRYGNNENRMATSSSPGDANGLETSAFKVSPAGVHQMTSFNESGMVYLSSLFSMESSNITVERDLFTCREIDKISLNRAVGKGTTKYVYKSAIDDRPVAIKMVTEKVKDISACKTKKGRDNIASCFQFANYKVLKEIALLQQLRHPNVAKLLGYCIKNEEPGRESVRLVMEYGNPIDMRTMSWPAKLQIALDLAELLHFLHRSPMGPLRIGDFKRDQFRLINDTLKLSDLDDLTADELTCTHPRSCFIMGKDMGVPCIDSVCENFNTVANVKVAKERFFNAIFRRVPSFIRDEVMELMSALSGSNIDTESLRNKIALIKKHHG